MTCEVENPLWVSLLFIDNLNEPIRKSNCSGLKSILAFVMQALQSMVS
ncbi:hypothetical protein NC652_011636 [Populus alba x Populus x berolinensis]|nr:hypothetical protein NC652_011636 [Populus alba x Populus x berolinensis]